MKALLLAAGRGERMRPLTDSCPKPLLTVHGRSLISHHLHALAAAGIRDVVVNSHHLAGQLHSALGDGSHWGLQLAISHEPVLLETGGALVAARDLLAPGPVLLVSTDIHTDFDYASLPDTLPGDTLAHLLLVPNPPHHQAGDFVLADNGRVGLPVAEDNTWNYGGIAVLDIALVAGRRASHFPLRDVLLPAIAAGKVTGQVHRGAWQNLGTPAQLAAVNRG